MKKSIFFILAALFLFVACKDSGKEDAKSHKSRRILTSSNGAINTLSVVINDSLWKGSIGEAIRDEFAAPVTGLPQEEPLFSLDHIPPNAFSGFVHSSRIFLRVKPSQKPYIEIAKDTFAAPQTGIFVSGPNDTTIINLLKQKKHQIIKTLKQTEIRANQHRIAKSLKDPGVLQERFGLTMKFPTIYRYAVKDDDFVWIRKEIPHGSMEILVYQVPFKTIDNDSSVVQNIVKMRDSIGKKYIPGHSEGSHMITEKAYAPYLYKTKVNGKFAYLTKGTWEVKGEFMAGPFVNYAIRDEKNKRYIILDGMVFKPQAPTKRNNIFELKAIFKSAKIN